MATSQDSNLAIIALPALSSFLPSEIVSEQTITAAFK